MLLTSSNRALISTTARTCLPASAASMSASTMGESPDVRYRVCLIASTRGSAAACSMKACTDVLNESYGWCSSTSLARIAAKMSPCWERSVGARSGWVDGTNGGSFRSDRSRSASRNSPVRSSGVGSRNTSFACTPSSRVSRSSTRSGMSSATSRRTGGPNRRRVSSFSRAVSRFSTSSSSTSRSSLRVTRNVQCSRTSMPGKSWSRCAAMRSSSGTKRVPAGRSPLVSLAMSETMRKRGRDCGTLTRAKCSVWVAGLFSTTARLSDRPEM